MGTSGGSDAPLPLSGDAGTGGSSAGAQALDAGNSPSISATDATDVGAQNDAAALDGSTGNDAGGSGTAADGAPGAPAPGEVGLAGAAPLTGLLGSTSRPQLSPSQAAEFSIANYLARKGALGALTTDGWDPTAGLDLTSLQPTYTVAPAGGMFRTIQEAVTAASSKGGSSRVYIQIAPGTYTEQVCVAQASPPVTLYGTGTDATKTVIAFANFQGGIGTLGANSCGGDTNQQAATVDAFAPGFQAANLTIQNTVTTAQLGASTATQAVALATTSDQVLLDRVRILSHQDTLYVNAPPNAVARVYVKNSTIAGDVDFIFGAATAVFDGCTIEFLSDRHASGGQPLAPDTDSRNAYGFLVVGGTITADANTANGVVGLGRAWDHNCTDVSTYVKTCVASGAYPNGQATVVNTSMDAHVNRAAPWAAAATTKRGYSATDWACVTGSTCPANRFYEFGNTGAGSATGM